MWSVTPQFLAALTQSPRFTRLVTCTTPDGTVTTLPVESGTVSMDSGQQIRRSTSLTATGGSSVYTRLQTPGAILDVKVGLQYATSSELVPVFRGEITDCNQDMQAGTIALTGADLATRLSRNRFINAYTPKVMQRTAVIAQVVENAIPGVTVVNTATDSGSTTSTTTWAAQSGPLDVISDMTKDGATEAFFRPDGVFLIRDRPTSDTGAVWSLRGILESAKRDRPLSSLYNTVVVTPSSTDGSQSWSQVVVSITNTTHPLHESNIGVSPYFWSSPTITTTADAAAAGRAILARLTGNAEALALGSISNPALEGGDVFNVVIPSIGGTDAQVFRHFVDSFELDLATGSMSLNTRKTLAANV